MAKKAPVPAPIKYRTFRGLSGLGLVATDTIADDENIIEYIGPRLKLSEVSDKPNQYLMEIANNKYIDGSNRTNIARYVNHSCEPNAYLVIERGRAWIRAAREIDPGEEITFDYGEDFFDTYIKPKGCRCEKCSPQ